MTDLDMMIIRTVDHIIAIGRLFRKIAENWSEKPAVVSAMLDAAEMEDRVAAELIAAAGPEVIAWFRDNRP